MRPRRFLLTLWLESIANKKRFEKRLRKVRGNYVGVAVVPPRLKQIHFKEPATSTQATYTPDPMMCDEVENVTVSAPASPSATMSSADPADVIAIAESS
jgi:hypothetical protein